MGRIKGAAIRARLEFIRSRYGDEALKRVVASLDGMDQVVLSGTILPSIWYPFQVLANLDEALRRELGGGGNDLFEEAGDHVALQHSRSIYRVFFRETEPERVLRLAACIFSNYYSGMGRMSLRASADGLSGRIQVSDATSSSRPHCLTTMAYFRGVLEACTGRPVAGRETRCHCWGDESCEFEFSWPAELQTAVGG
jgi:predicted hydrocarbon binding protein